VRLRKTPDLQFRWDESLEHGERINFLLSTITIPPKDLMGDTESEIDDASDETLDELD